jgi:hypothetical protein
VDGAGPVGGCEHRSGPVPGRRPHVHALRIPEGSDRQPPHPARGRIEYAGTFLTESSRTRYHLAARASGIDILRFHGFGNETTALGSKDFYKVRQRQYVLAPAVTFGLGRRSAFSVGPIVEYATTELSADTFIGQQQPYGSDPFGQVGLRIGATVDTRDSPTFTQRGLAFAIEARAFPSLWSVEDAFTVVLGEGTTALTKGRVTLALRAGGKWVEGRYPFHEAASIGGAETVRGFRVQRFSGDAAVWGNAELRLRLFQFLVLVPGEMGVFGLTDVGRVFLSGESSDAWHNSLGGGLWISVLSRRQTVSVAVATSEEDTTLYVRGGLSF